MFIQFNPNVKGTIAFLKVNNDTVNDTLQKHTDWASMLCIKDSLQKWNIPYALGKTDIDKIDELPIPFMAHTHERENLLVGVTNITDTPIETYEKNIINQLQPITHKSHNNKKTEKLIKFIKSLIN
jgi:hypothetical protein